MSRPPKDLSFLVESRPAAGEEPQKLPAEGPMNVLNHPCPPQEFPAFGFVEGVLEPIGFPAGFKIPLDSRLQTIEHARHGDERGSAFAFDGSKDLRGIRGRLENHRRSKERWNKERHELAKDMAQRNKRHKTQRV